MSDNIFYPATALTGGGDHALDGYDGASLVDGDRSLTITTTEIYIHLLDDDSGAAESSPAVIAPDTNAGTKRWILISKFRVSETSSTTFKIGSSGTIEYNQSSPSGTDVLGYNGYLYATRVYNPVFADYADFRDVADFAHSGLVYIDSQLGAKIATENCQKGIIGVASDTYGHAVGINPKHDQVPIAVSGWVLAYVDREYTPGTALTSRSSGMLTKMKWWQKILFPERIVATYSRREPMGTLLYNDKSIVVDGRHWVKVN
jgi:hypothetical protein